jgi:hypothetical protein
MPVRFCNIYQHIVEGNTGVAFSFIAIAKNDGDKQMRICKESKLACGNPYYI